MLQKRSTFFRACISWKEPNSHMFRPKNIPQRVASQVCILPFTWIEIGLATRKARSGNPSVERHVFICVSNHERGEAGGGGGLGSLCMRNTTGEGREYQMRLCYRRQPPFPRFLPYVTVLSTNNSSARETASFICWRSCDGRIPYPS